jgi:hypothetical protein
MIEIVMRIGGRSAKATMAAVAIAIAAIGGTDAPQAGLAAPRTGLKLLVSDRSPRQLRGVTMRAQSAPGGSFLVYYFQYGDGIVEPGTQPLASHGYAKPGRYHARVSALTPTGDTFISPAVTITVRDGLPPTVAISSPRPSARVRVGAHGMTMRGTATDAGGVRRVQLAIQLVSSRRHFRTGGRCIWWDPRLGLALADCASPDFFDVHLHRGHWSFRLGPRPAVPAGVYVVRIRASDRAGNVSNAYAERLRTILPFTVTG